MTWLTWRQFRTNAIVATAALAALAIVLAVTKSDGAGYLSHHHLIEFLGTGLVAVPALIGAFWGAPLIAREYETGTYRLAWTQGVTRNRWLANKVALTGLASVAAVGLYTLALTHWSSAAENLDRFGSAMFAERGIAPMGYAAFGFALGVTAGVLLRRTLPAMATTLVGFLVVRIIISTWVRPHFATPLRITQSLAAQQHSPGLQAKPGAWVLSNNNSNAAGNITNNVTCAQGVTSFRSKAGVVTTPHLTPAAVNAAQRAAQKCLGEYRQVLTYQPANRYWTFQTYETAIFAGLALLLVGLCSWWLRHRLT